MKLNIKTRLKLCWEILTVTSGHSHTAQEKILSTYVRGYDAGVIDARLEAEKLWDAISKMRLALACIADNPGWNDHHCRAKATLDKVRSELREVR